jgi:hypothetical protein
MKSSGTFKTFTLRREEKKIAPMFRRYRFESEIYPALSRIPLHVRMKLDLTGIKIALQTWLAFSHEERQVLCHLPVETAEERGVFSAYLDSLSRRYLGEKVSQDPPATDHPWKDPGRVPDPVQAKSGEIGQVVTLGEWSGWDLYQRYALWKLSISKNEPEQFYRGLREFREEIRSSS